MKLLASALVLVLSAGCGNLYQALGFGEDREPIPAEELEPVFPAPDGGPPIECRGLPRDRCEGAGTMPEGAVSAPLAQVQRVVVSCESERCDANNGEFRMDVVLLDGTTEWFGAGAYGESQLPAP